MSSSVVAPEVLRLVVDLAVPLEGGFAKAVDEAEKLGLVEVRKSLAAPLTLTHAGRQMMTRLFKSAAMFVGYLVDLPAAATEPAVPAPPFPAAALRRLLDLAADDPNADDDLTLVAHGLAVPSGNGELVEGPNADGMLAIVCEAARRHAEVVANSGRAQDVALEKVRVALVRVERSMADGDTNAGTVVADLIATAAELRRFIV